jgi:hypothetical protein
VKLSIEFVTIIQFPFPAKSMPELYSIAFQPVKINVDGGNCAILIHRVSHFFEQGYVSNRLEIKKGHSLIV